MFMRKVALFVVLVVANKNLNVPFKVIIITRYKKAFKIYHLE